MTIIPGSGCAFVNGRLTIETKLPIYVGASAVSCVTGQAISFEVRFSNSTSTATYSATGLPAGLSIDADTGVISGIVTEGDGTVNSVVTCTNGRGSKNALITWIVGTAVANVPVITSPSEYSGMGAQPFSYTITANYVTAEYAPVSYTKVSGYASATVNASTGAITLPGNIWPSGGLASTTVTVKATNVNGDSANHVITLSATAEDVTPWNVKDAEDAALTAPMVLTNDYVWQNAETYDPASAGRANFTFTCPPGEGGAYYISAQVTAATLSDNSFFVQQTSDPTTSNVWHIYPTSGEETRAVNWTDTADNQSLSTAPKIFTFAEGANVIKVWGRESDTRLHSLTATKLMVPTNLIATGINGTVGVQFNCQLSSDNWPTTWTVMSGSLPAGLTLSASTGLISGQPSSAGTSAFTVRATNAAGNSATNLSVSIIIAAGAVPVVTTSGPFTAIDELSFSLQLAATGNPTSWAIASGSLPTGLSLNVNSGLISGTPTVADQVGTFTVTATNAAGTSSASASISITVLAATGRTFYIDSAAASDTAYGQASGQSKTTPWKRCPGMTGFAGAYNHQSGDRFIFKGGSTWSGCWPLTIWQGGSSDSVRDFYGTDATWYSGGSFTRPLFDFQNQTPSGGKGISFSVGNFTFDNIEIANCRTGVFFGSAMISGYGVCNNVTFNNCVIRDWSVAGPWNGGGGIAYFGGGGGNNLKLTYCEVTQSNAGQISGAAVYNFGHVSFCEVHHCGHGLHGGGTYHDNHIHHLLDATYPNNDGTPSGLTAHQAAIITYRTSEIYNNVMHDISGTTAPIELGGAPYIGIANAVDLVYNNVIYATQTQPVIWAKSSTANEATYTARILNNTIEANSAGGAIVFYIAGGSNFGTLDVRNNHIIRDSGTGIDVTTSATNRTVTNNATMTAAQASAAGASTGNNYQPTSGATINAGVDASAYLTTDILGVARPQGGTWDIGAYES